MSAVIGVDPGGTTGLAVIVFDPLLTHGGYGGALGQYTDRAELIRDIQANVARVGARRIAAERFVVSRRAGRSATAGAGQQARDILGQLNALGVPLTLRTASEVKRWATNKRLDAAGLLAPTVGKPHARDACRHALFSLVADLGCPDPLSATYRPETTTHG